MVDHLFLELLKTIIKVLAWFGENLPDDPRLGRKLLLAGGVLVCVIFVPSTSPDWGNVIFGLQLLCVLGGGLCLILGSFVFFRRWVWRRQDKRAPVIMSLELGRQDERPAVIRSLGLK